MNKQAVGLTTLRIVLGIFFILESVNKLAWLADGGILAKQLQEWLQNALPSNRWYLETVAIPGAPVFARIVMAGELALGLGLLAGVWVRAAALLALAIGGSKLPWSLKG